METLRSLAKRIPYLPLVVQRVKNFEIYRRRIRRRLARSYYFETQRQIESWAKARTEQSNFYYKLKRRNREDLLSLLSVLLGIEKQILRNYILELDTDKVLHKHIATYLKQNSSTLDSKVAFGRREGWYVITRALKPRVVVETGVHHGVGACLLASALIRNREEGFDGRYIGTEINKDSGHLFKDIFSSVGEIIYDDSITTLKKIDTPIDLFINDSDHSTTYEAREYDTVKDKMSESGVILGDNAHVTDSLREFSEANGRHFIFFSEQPEDHWYPGGGIGISLPMVPVSRNNRTVIQH